MSTSTDSSAAPYFLNCQFIAEGIDYVGKNIQDVISKPIRASVSTEMFDMGEKNQKTAGRCGACKAMGCEAVPKEMNAAILKFQEFQILHTDNSYYTFVKKKIINFLIKCMANDCRIF